MARFGNKSIKRIGQKKKTKRKDNEEKQSGETHARTLAEWLVNVGHLTSDRGKQNAKSTSFIQKMAHVLKLRF